MDETDDAIAAYALQYGSDTQIVIASQDSDFFQLITENVTVLRYRAERLKRNYRLIKLDDHAALPFVIDELRYTYDGITTTEVLVKIGVK